MEDGGGSARVILVPKPRSSSSDSNKYAIDSAVGGDNL